MRIIPAYWLHDVGLAVFIGEVLQQCDLGVSENALDTANNTAMAFGRLIDVLATKGIISTDEVKHIVGGWKINGAEFIP